MTFSGFNPLASLLRALDQAAGLGGNLATADSGGAFALILSQALPAAPPPAPAAAPLSAGCASAAPAAMGEVQDAPLQQEQEKRPPKESVSLVVPCFVVPTPPPPDASLSLPEPVPTPARSAPPAAADATPEPPADPAPAAAERPVEVVLLAMAAAVTAEPLAPKEPPALLPPTLSFDPEPRPLPPTGRRAEPAPAPLAFAARIVERPAARPALPVTRPAPTGREAAPGQDAGAASQDAPAEAPQPAASKMPLRQAQAAAGETAPPAEPEVSQTTPGKASAPADKPGQAAVSHPGRVVARDSLPDRAAAAQPLELAPPLAAGHRLDSARTALPEAEAAAPVKGPLLQAPEPAPQRWAAPPREVQLRLGETGHEPLVQVRVTEQAGELKVAVRTSSTELTNSLRAGLPELVDRLGQRGFETQVWRPAAAESHPSSSAREIAPRQAESSGGTPDRGDSGQQHGGAEQRRHPGNGDKSPQWSEEWESSSQFPPDRKDRSNFPWLQA